MAPLLAVLLGIVLLPCSWSLATSSPVVVYLPPSTSFVESLNAVLANTSAQEYQINLEAAVYSGCNGTVSLSAGSALSVAIVGLGANATVLECTSTLVVPLFVCSGTCSASLESLTIRNMVGMSAVSVEGGGMFFLWNVNVYNCRSTQEAISVTRARVSSAALQYECSQYLSGSYSMQSSLSSSNASSFVVSVSGSSSILYVSNSNFSSNVGLIGVRDGATVQAHNCVFEYNTASEGLGGFMFMEGGAQGNVTASTFVNNLAHGGGDIFAFGDVTLSISSTTIIGSQALDHDLGGGSALGACNTTLIYVDCNAVSTNATGYGGFVHVESSSNVNVQNFFAYSLQSSYGAFISGRGNSTVVVYGASVSLCTAIYSGGVFYIVDSLVNLADTSVTNALANSGAVLSVETNVGSAQVEVIDVYFSLLPLMSDSAFWINGGDNMGSSVFIFVEALGVIIPVLDCTSCSDVTFVLDIPCGYVTPCSSSTVGPAFCRENFACTTGWPWVTEPDPPVPPHISPPIDMPPRVNGSGVLVVAFIVFALFTTSVGFLVRKNNRRRRQEVSRIRRTAQGYGAVPTTLDGGVRDGSGGSSGGAGRGQGRGPLAPLVSLPPTYDTLTSESSEQGEPEVAPLGTLPPYSATRVDSLPSYEGVANDDALPAYTPVTAAASASVVLVVEGRGGGRGGGGGGGGGGERLVAASLNDDGDDGGPSTSLLL